MSDKRPEGQTRRRYPPLYERLVPIAMVLIGLAIIVILLIIIAVVMGFVPGN
jgi:hypothetical protein